MSIVSLLVMLAVVGLAAWALVTYIPMPSQIKMVIIGVAVIACIVYALHAMGIVIPNPPTPQLK